MTDTATPRAKPATTTARPRATAGMAGLWLVCLAAMGAGLIVDTWRTPAALLASEWCWARAWAFRQRRRWALRRFGEW